MPLISVLIPCHNAAPWLDDAVQSIQRQTYRNVEILLYDDGSTDGSGEIIQRLASHDDRIFAMGGGANQGIVHALNAMLCAARGIYIARMDADDISLPQRLEQQLRFVESGRADLCGTWFQEFGGGITRAVRWFASPDELRAALLFQNAICHPTVLARREVFEAFPYRESYNLAEDYDLFARASARFRLANMPEVLLRYRRHSQQATRLRRAKMEEVTRRIRIEALQAQGIEATQDEQNTHNLIRAPQSIRSLESLERIEDWLSKLVNLVEHPDAKRVVASQWVRAAVRAAPLGWKMWRKYRQSPLHALSGGRAGSDIDLALLAASRMDYASRAFDALRRFGLSA
jgi:hypothetical protein